MISAICFCTNLGLKTRIVSNGHWGKSLETQVTEKNVIKPWRLRGNDTHTYDITNNLHNAINKLATDITNINNLTKEE